MIVVQGSAMARPTSVVSGKQLLVSEALVRLS